MLVRFLLLLLLLLVLLLVVVLLLVLLVLLVLLLLLGDWSRAQTHGRFLKTQPQYPRVLQKWFIT